MFSLFADKMKGPTKVLAFHVYFFTCRRILSKFRTNIGIMKNISFNCRQNERPDKNIGIPHVFLHLPTNFVKIQNKYRYYDFFLYLFADKMKGPTKVLAFHVYFFTCRWILSKFRTNIGIMKNVFFICRQNERPDKSIGIPRVFLHLSTNFVNIQNKYRYHEKCFLYLPTKWKARQKYWHFMCISSLADEFCQNSEQIGIMKNISFICRQNERPDKNIGIPRVFLHLPTNFVKIQNKYRYHEKCFLYLPTKWKARQKISAF